MTPNPRAKKRKQDEWEQCIDALGQKMLYYEKGSKEYALLQNYFAASRWQTKADAIFSCINIVKEHMPKAKPKGRKK